MFYRHFLCRFHGLGIDGQKSVKDLLRMESEEENSDSELLDIENPSTPDNEENSSFHSGFPDSPAAKADIKHNNNNSDGGVGVGAESLLRRDSSPASISEDREASLGLYLLKPTLLSNLNKSDHAAAAADGIRNWLKNSRTLRWSLASHRRPRRPCPRGLGAGLPHPHPLHPFLLPFRRSRLRRPLRLRRPRHRVQRRRLCLSRRQRVARLRRPRRRQRRPRRCSTPLLITLCSFRTLPVSRFMWKIQYNTVN